MILVYETGLHSQLADLCMGDIDGDGKPDLAMINYGTGAFTVFRNSVGEPKIVPSGNNPLLSETVNRLIIDPLVQTYNGHTYVQRHYEVKPVSNSDNSTATVTLYFSQEDFNNFNAFPDHGLSLPTGPEDNAGIGALRIYQYHGSSASGLPGSYAGNAMEINPNDSGIVWNASAQWWEVTFDITGFSGFFAGSGGSAILPLKLLSFSAMPQANMALLQWTTSQEDNVAFFEVQRSTGAGIFSKITAIPAAGIYPLTHTYKYPDTIGKEPVYYYRLKMVDYDGSFTYSKVVSVTSAGITSRVTIYPNPAKDYVIIKHPSLNYITQLSVIDMMGKVVKNMVLDKNTSQSVLSLKGLSAGNYKIIWRHGSTVYIYTIMISN